MSLEDRSGRRGLDPVGFDPYMHTLTAMESGGNERGRGRKLDAAG